MIIGIDCGHSIKGSGCGAVGILSESVENRKVGNRLMELLKIGGHTVVNCSVDYASNTNEQLAGIVRKANAQRLDLFVSIHFNSGGGHGTETYVYSSTSSARAKAQAINDHVVKSCGFRNRGLKYSKDLYVLKYTNAPAILHEVCFVDSVEDSNKLNTEAVAKAIYKGITGQEAPTGCNYTKEQFIKEIQAISGAVVDGIAGNETLSKTVTISRYKNNSHAMVKPVQKYLNTLGFDCGTADGIAGAKFETAVINYQKKYNLYADGEITAQKNTWKKLLGLI